LSSAQEGVAKLQEENDTLKTKLKYLQELMICSGTVGRGEQQTQGEA
jgi:hypothetical protein